MDTSQPIDVSKVERVEDLKSLAYDFLLQKNTASANLRIVENEIKKRGMTFEIESKEKPVEKPTKK